MPAAHVSCKYLTSTIKRAHGTFVCIMSGLGNRLQDYDLHSQWKTDGIDCLPTCHRRVSIGNTTVLAGQLFALPFRGSAFIIKNGRRIHFSVRYAFYSILFMRLSASAVFS